MTPLASQAGKAVSWQIEANIEAVREATRELRRFLSTEGVSSDEQNGWELVCMEACTNAVKYAQTDQLALPIELRVTLTTSEVEIQIEDHTPGFDWPEKSALPESISETGRGLFLISELTDSAHYFRHRSANRLVLRRARTGHGRVSEENLQASKIIELEQTLDTMTEELAACYESLSAIFRFTAELGQAENSAAFASRWLNQLVAVAGVDWFVFRMAENDGTFLVTCVASRPDLNFEALSLPEDLHQEYPIEIHAVLGQQDVWIEADSALLPSDPMRQAGSYSAIVCHPVFLQGNLVGVLTVGRGPGKGAFTAGQVNIVHTFADFLGIQLRNARNQEENLRGRLVTRELEIAANIQRSLLPDRLPTPPGLRLTGYSQSASKVGGDFYDAIELKDGTLLLVIADVMGKGVPAAMFAAIFRSHLRARPELA
ncbi:MAG TPA: ATP-binding protein, partial [Candidatus Limnocylindria bacterium]|nr:ATP-binding protein [Candidatus Limnocylindria bacterium]